MLRCHKRIHTDDTESASHEDVDIEEDRNIKREVEILEKLTDKSTFIARARAYLGHIVTGVDVDAQVTTINNLLAQAQQRKHLNESSIYSKIARRELTVAQAWELRVDAVTKVDDVGANVIHCCYLFENFEIGRILVQRFPEEALATYRGELLEEHQNKTSPKDIMPYSGENILHMTIVKRNLEETKWLLEFFHKSNVKNALKILLTANAYGTFFKKNGTFYFGSHPLHFAVCTNRIDIFDLVLNYCSSVVTREREKDKINDPKEERFKVLGPNSIFMRDDYGNTLLHLCVLRNLKEMYSHVLQRAEEIVKNELRMEYMESVNFESRMFSLRKMYYPIHDRKSSDIPEDVNLAGNPPNYPVPCNDVEFIPMPDVEDKFDLSKIPFDQYTTCILEDRLLYALNSDYLTPLTIAAQGLNREKTEESEQKKKEMLAFLIDKQKQIKWKYGPLTCSTLYLEGLDLPCNPNRYNDPAQVRMKCKCVMDILCANDSDVCISIDEIKKIIDVKWSVFGFPNFIWNCLVNFLILVLMTILLCYINHTPTRNLVEKSEWVVTFFYPATALFLLSLSCMELPQIWMHGLDYWGWHGGIRGAAVFDKACRTLLMLSFLSLCIWKGIFGQMNKANDYYESDGSYVQQDYPPIKISMAFCILSAYSYVYYFFMGFNQTGPFVLIIYRIISQKIPYFLGFYLVILVGFACALSMLTNSGDPDSSYGFYHLWLAIWTLIKFTVGMDSTNNAVDIEYVPEDLRWLFDLLLTVFYIIVVLMMLNLLIAMINDTWSELTKYNETILLMEKYNIMSSMQRSLTDAELARVLRKYTITPRLDEIMILENAGKDSKKININVDRKVYEIKIFDETWWNTNESSVAEVSAVGRVCLLVVDPQNDYLSDNGCLRVNNAEYVKEKLTEFLRDNRMDIAKLIVTMESRYYFNISHPRYWKAVDSEESPKDGDIIKRDDVILNRIWEPRQPSCKEWSLEYIKKCKEIVIKSPHCIVGTKGQSILPEINDEIQEWTKSSGVEVEYICKGQNGKTEMFSAFRAVKEVPGDKNTKFNQYLLDMLHGYDALILFAVDQIKPNATDHISPRSANHPRDKMLLNTIRDLSDNWNSDSPIICIQERSNSGSFDDSSEFNRFCMENGITLCTAENCFNVIRNKRRQLLSKK